MEALDSSEPSLNNLLDLACDPDRPQHDTLSLEEVSLLAQALAASGTQIQPQGTTVDVASTGGPASLSTLLCPLIQVSDGYTVPKLGVPGRPAGGIDTLGTIPGYVTQPSPEMVTATLATSRYAHFEAAQEWAPLDGALFGQRQRRGAQVVPGLVIASLLAKKLAVGVNHVILDVRVAAHGNFGPNMAIAAANAGRFQAVAALAGIDAHPVLTDATNPPQPAIGRGEALLALLHLVDGRDWAGPASWLVEHLHSCTQLARSGLSTNATTPPTASLRAALQANLTAQGSSMDLLRSYATTMEGDEQLTLRADVAGRFAADLGAIRAVLVTSQASAGHGACYPDGAGVTLLARPGIWTSRGEPLALVRARAPLSAADLAVQLHDAIRTDS